jgi:hypothetical protein
MLVAKSCVTSGNDVSLDSAQDKSLNEHDGLILCRNAIPTYIWPLTELVAQEHDREHIRSGGVWRYCSVPNR